MGTLFESLMSFAVFYSLVGTINRLCLTIATANPITVMIPKESNMVPMPGLWVATSGILVLLKLLLSGVIVAVFGPAPSTAVPWSGSEVVALLWYKRFTVDVL